MSNKKKTNLFKINKKKIPKMPVNQFLKKRIFSLMSLGTWSQKMFSLYFHFVVCLFFLLSNLFIISFTRCFLFFFKILFFVGNMCGNMPVLLIVILVTSSRLSTIQAHSMCTATDVCLNAQRGVIKTKFSMQC